MGKGMMDAVEASNHLPANVQRPQFLHEVEILLEVIVGEELRRALLRACHPPEELLLHGRSHEESELFSCGFS